MAPRSIVHVLRVEFTSISFNSLIHRRLIVLLDVQEVLTDSTVAVGAGRARKKVVDSESRMSPVCSSFWISKAARSLKGF